MRGRFTRQQLYELRNKVPMRSLIADELAMANRMSGNIFRFECPICRGWHTGVKTETNLARCFDCNININTIEMVGKIRQTEFYESASFLWKLYKSMQSPAHIPSPEPVRSAWPVQLEPEDTAGLISIGSIMENFGFPSGAGEDPSRFRKMKARIEILEKDLLRLKNQVDKLQKFVIATAGVKHLRKREQL